MIVKNWKTILGVGGIVVSGYVAFAVLQTKHEALAQDVEKGMAACWEFKDSIDNKLDKLLIEIHEIRISQAETRKDIEYLKDQCK